MRKRRKGGGKTREIGELIERETVRKRRKWGKKKLRKRRTDRERR